ncbi:cofactor assembly of complex C subunit B [Candidatus Synechococcus spongiarum]|nr:cofactor assembly of complex C subunit B [Candidatus Synechococcus spongiarum]
MVNTPWCQQSMTTGARLSLLTGSIGSLALALNHLTAGNSPANVSLGRADVVGSLMAVGLMLVGLNWTRVDPAAQQPLALAGEQGLQLAEGLPDGVREELGWGSQMLLLNTAAVAVHCVWNQRLLLSRGLLTGVPYQDGPLVQRVLSGQQRLYLVNLKLFPARREFTYLPEGTPAVLLEPLGAQGLLVVAGASPRCFSAADLGWVKGWAERLGRRLEEAEAAKSFQDQ